MSNIFIEDLATWKGNSRYYLTIDKDYNLKVYNREKDECAIKHFPGVKGLPTPINEYSLRPAHIKWIFEAMDIECYEEK